MSISYRASGVDQRAADELVPVFAELAARTRRLEPTPDLGGFAGLVSLEGIGERGYRRPGLVVSTDGVGTKVELLQRTGRHHTAGWDAVAMNVDDVVCAGAAPLLFVDYVSVERLDRDVVTEIVTGVSDGCIEAGCALVGGETSQHPGLLPPGGYDVVGTCVGIVDIDRTWGPGRVRPGDAVVGCASSGPHSNGFSLIRRLLDGDDPPVELLAPTRIYAGRLLEAAGSVEIHAAAHVTGGGIAGNLQRVLPDGTGARIDTAAWPRPAWCDWIRDRGVPSDELFSTFNAGLGLLVVAPDGPAAVAALHEAGVDSWVVGEVTREPGIQLSAQR